MPDETTRIIISIETLLKGLDKTLAGLSKVEKQLRTLTQLKPQAGPSTSFDRATVAAQKLVTQQQRLAVQTQELANRQERARQSSERLVIAQLRLEAATARAAKSIANSGQQLDSHVRFFRANEQAARDFTTRMNRLGSAFRSIGQGLTSFGATLSISLTAPLVAFGTAAVEAATQMDSLQRGLTAITGSSVEAGVQLKRLTEIAKLPGIGFQEAIQGSIRLQAVGFSAEQAEKALIQFSNAIALTGGGRDELARVTVQLGQLAAKGRVLSQDLRPIIEAAPAVGKALRQAFGTVNADDIQSLGLSTEEFFDILVKQLAALPRASAGARNEFENFRDAVFRAAAAVGQALLPALLDLIKTAEPIITRLAQAFANLPKPLQTLAITAGIFSAALGPALFIFGQFATGLGRVVVGFAQLNSLGLLPTITNLKVFAATATQAIAALTGLQTATVAAAAPWVGLALLIAGVATALILYSRAEEKAIVVDLAAAKARTDHLKTVQDELKFLEELAEKTSLTTDEQKKLADSYNSLSGAAKGRVALLGDEKEKLEALIAAKREQLKLDQFARQATSAQLVKNVTVAINEQTKAQQSYTEAQKQFASATIDAATASSNLFGAKREHPTVEEVLAQQEKASLAAADALEKIGQADVGVNNAAKAIVELSSASGISTETILQQAQAAGTAKTEIDKVRKAIEDLILSEKNAGQAIDDTTKSLLNQRIELSKLGEAADAAKKAREALISAAIAQVRESSNTTAEARKNLDALIKKFPELGKAIQKEQAAKPIEQFLNEITGKKLSKSQTTLRNAQEQLAKALADVARASADEQAAITRASNEQQLQLNESSFKLQLIAYRQYLNERARLTQSNLQLEVDAQQRIVDEAIAERDRLLAAGGRRGLPAGERVRRRAQAAGADEKRIRAQERIVELQGRQRQVVQALDQEIAQASREQVIEIRKLEVEYGQLAGRIEDALKLAADDRFLETLQGLVKSQEDLNKRLELAKQIKDADLVAELEAAQAQNQRQIETIRGINDRQRALAVLEASENLITRAQEKQSLLEKDLTFQVEFRGLKEEEAIRQRLAGEEKLRKALLLSRDIVQDEIAALQARGVAPPQALLDFIRNTNAAIKGLGELGFSEQFRLAQKEFDRLNDARLAAIADVERAVRHRDIAEAEGRILIKKINGEYVADLEKQVEVLRKIAELSGQQPLIKQAEDARQTAADVRTATDEMAEFSKALRSVSIDALGDALEQFFVDLTDNTKSAEDKLKSLLLNFSSAINRFISEQLSKKLLESIFGDPSEQAGAAGGIIGAIKRLFGFGGEAKAAGGIAEKAGHEAVVATTLETAATTAAASLTTGGTSAAAALGTGGTTAATAMATGGTTFSASVLAAATGFASAVVAAGTAFAAAVTAAATAQGATGVIPKALGDLVSARTGGRVIRVAEAGHAEAVLTTDPRHADRQLGILREFLRRTRGLGGRIQAFAEGGFTDRATAEQNMLMRINRAPRVLGGSDVAVAGAGSGGGNLRLIVVDDQRQVANWINSPQGDKVMTEWLIRKTPTINRRIRR